ncbi:MAG: ribonuclease P protein component [bacterium]|nr:ribonuclease P protein component [bacterium]
MLTRENRLTKKRDFLIMGRKGRSVFGQLMTLRIRSVQGDEQKIGFVTPVKTFKKAVDRNRVKRRSRHLFRELLPTIQEGIHISVLLKPGVLTATSNELRFEIERLLKRIPEVLLKPATISPREKKMRAKRKK